MFEINDSIPFDESELGMEIPPVPEHYQQLVAEWGGNSEGVPNVRLVSGTDPLIVDWCAGQWIPRYSFPEVDTINYAIWHKPDGTKKIITPAEANVMNSSTKIDGIILPVTETKVKDWLIPRYFVEVYRLPSYFGTRAQWEKERFVTGENGDFIDLMGEYPENGAYETWFCIEDLKVDEYGKVVASTFRTLDDEVMETIREHIHVAKTKSNYEQAVEATTEWHEAEAKKTKQFKENVKDALNERIDRIMDVSKNIRTK